MNSLDCALSAVMLSAAEQLSATPINPYQALKAQLFPSDYKFPTIDDVQVPESVTIEGMIAKIQEIETNYQKNLIETQINSDKYTVHEPDGYLSILAECSGDNCFVVTEEKQKGYIEYLELIRSTDIDSVNQDNCREIAKKLGYFYLTKVGKATVRI
jgi:hypothetical protein